MTHYKGEVVSHSKPTMLCTTHKQRPSNRLFLMDDLDDCRSDVNTMRTSRTSGRSSRQGSSDGGEVHLRLYQRSLPRQQKGKEMRKKIEKARNPTPPTVLRVTEKEATEIIGRLYRPVVKEKKQKVVSTEPERKKSPKINAFNAQRLYEKLYTQQRNHGDGKQTRIRHEDNGSTSTVEVQERSARRMTEGNAQSLFQRLHSETMRKDQQHKNLLKESKSDRNVRLIREVSAKKLFERLHTEKKKADIIKPSEQRRGPSLDKRTAEGLFERLHLEKKKGDLIHAPDLIRGPRMDKKSAKCMFERLHKEKMGKLKSSE
jgi:hypothetical protein